MHPIRVQGGGEVEGAGHRCAPVHQEGAHFVVAGVQPQPTDIAAIQIGGAGHRILRLLIGHVDAAEHQSDLRDGEVIQPLRDVVDLAVTAHQPLRIVDICCGADTSQPLLQRGGRSVHLSQQVIEMILLACDGLCERAVGIIRGAARCGAGQSTSGATGLLELLCLLLGLLGQALRAVL